MQLREIWVGVRRGVVVIRDDLLQLEVDEVVRVERALLLLDLGLRLGLCVLRLSRAIEVDICGKADDT